MTQEKFILVGAKNPDAVLQREGFGGVLTLSNSIVDYATDVGYDITIIDTLRKPFLEISFLSRLKSGLSRVFKLIKLLRNDKYNGVIIFSGAGFSFYERIFLSIICRIARIPSVIFIVDGWFFNIRDEFVIKRRWIGLLLKIPNVIAASGSRWMGLFKELGIHQSRIITIPYWLPKSFGVALQPKVLTSGEYINFVFVGWMIREKGIDEILDVIESLYKKFEFKFTFIGGGPMLEDVRKKISILRWDSRVFALGLLSNSQKERELALAHVFVLPSYAEGFPMSLIEALSVGMPVICSDVGGISDSVHSGVNGYLIRPKDTALLKGAMEFYITNPEVITRHSLGSLQLARDNHDADRNCEVLFNSFKDKYRCAA